MYLHGKSVIGIVAELERLGVESHTGKHEVGYLCEDNNPAIISKESFQAMQVEKQRRSNVAKGEDGIKRKRKKYSSKKGF